MFTAGMNFHHVLRTRRTPRPYLDRGRLKEENADVCFGGTIGSKGKDEHGKILRIPFYNVLWAELLEDDLNIRYTADSGRKDVVRPVLLSYSVEKGQAADAVEWVDKLLEYAYGRSQRRKRIKVLVNPAGGQGRAVRLFTRDIKPIFVAAQCEIDVEQTGHRGHAAELAENLDIAAYDVVACCSGDGLPHEVFNGLGRRKDAARALRKIAVVQLPCGSGNAMCWNLCGTGSASLAALCFVKGLRTAFDLVSITQGNRRTLSFLSQAVGIVAEVDLATEHLRWIGELRFMYGFLTRLVNKRVYPCDIAAGVMIADKAGIREHYERELGGKNTPFSDREDDHRSFTTAADEAADQKSDQGLPPLLYGSSTDPLPQGSELVPYDQLGSFYAGNMAFMTSDGNFFPAALPADGCLDVFHAPGDIDRRVALKTMLAVQNNTVFDLEHLSYRKVLWYRVVPRHGSGGIPSRKSKKRGRVHGVGGEAGGEETGAGRRDNGNEVGGSGDGEESGKEKGYISIDGEHYPFEPFQAEVHQRLGTVLSKNGQTYEAPRLVPRPGADIVVGAGAV